MSSRQAKLPDRGDRRAWFRLAKPVAVRWQAVEEADIPAEQALERELPQVLQLAGILQRQHALIPAGQHALWQLLEQKLDSQLTLLLGQQPGLGQVGQLADISASGGCLQLPAPLPAAGYLRLLLLPPLPGHPIQLYARVVRRTVNDAVASLGLRWCCLRACDRELLIRCILAWQARQLRQQTEKTT